MVFAAPRDIALLLVSEPRFGGAFSFASLKAELVGKTAVVAQTLELSNPKLDMSPEQLGSISTASRLAPLQPTLSKKRGRSAMRFQNIIAVH